VTVSTKALQDSGGAYAPGMHLAVASEPVHLGQGRYDGLA